MSKPKRRQGYRMATDGERVILNKHGLCWLVREYSDGTTLSCPNPRLESAGTCQHHASFDPNSQPDAEAEEVSTP